jgi:hypothetical protein
MSASCEAMLRRLGCALLAVAVAAVPQVSYGVAVEPTGASEGVSSTEASAPDEPDEASVTPDEVEESTDTGAEVEEERDRAEALEAFRGATRSYELGRYEEAIAGFERAWELTAAPQLLYNIGQAYWRRFDVEPDVEHLRRARTFFRNYDKRMQGTEFYDPIEINRAIEQIDAQIEEREALEAERRRPVITGPSLAEQEAALRRRLERERQYRATRAYNATGVTFIVLGAASLVMGIAGLTTRVTTGAVLDNAGGGSGGINLASAEQDSRRRHQYLVAGRVAFAGFVAGAVMLPVGVTLRLVGRSRTRRGLGDPLAESGPEPGTEPEPEPVREREARRSSLSIEPSGGLLTVRF